MVLENTAAVPDVDVTHLGFSPEVDLTFFDHPVPPTGCKAMKEAGYEGDGPVLGDPRLQQGHNAVPSSLPASLSGNDEKKRDPDLVGLPNAWGKGGEGLGVVKTDGLVDCPVFGVDPVDTLMESTIDSFEGADFSSFLRSDTAPYLSLLDESAQSELDNKPQASPRTSSQESSPSCSPEPEAKPSKTRSSRRAASGAMRRQTKAKKTTAPVESSSTSRGAVMARLNREKKKAYISGLEEQVAKLTEQQASSQDTITQLQADLASARAQITYLKDVLHHQPQLAGLLSVLKNAQIPSTAPGTRDLRKRARRDDDVSIAMSTQPAPSTVIPLQFNITLPAEWPTRVDRSG